MFIEPVAMRRRVHQVVGDILEAKRHQLDLSYRDLQEKLQERCPYTYSYIYRICKAQRHLDPRAVSEIAGALNFDEDYLSFIETLVRLPEDAGKLSDTEVGRLTFSYWEALVGIAILASGLPDLAERYLGFYRPNYSFTRNFSLLLEELPEPLKLSALATLHQLIVNNRHEYSKDACAKKHFALYYGGVYGDSRLKQEVREAAESEKSAKTRRAGYVGLVLGLDLESASRYLKWFAEDEPAKQADIAMHVGYYGGLKQSLKHLVDQLLTPGFAPLWPCSLNSLGLLTLRREDSLQVLGSLLGDKSTIAQIKNNLSGNFIYDDPLLKKAWQSFLTQVGHAAPALARQLAN